MSGAAQWFIVVIDGKELTRVPSEDLKQIRRRLPYKGVEYLPCSAPPPVVSSGQREQERQLGLFDNCDPQGHVCAPYSNTGVANT